MADVTLDINVNIKKPAKSIQNFAKSATRALQSVTKSFTGLKVLAAGVVGFLAGRELVQGIKAVTDAASIQEDAINSLNTALKVSGKFSQEASQDLQNFASGIQQSTTFGDELILQQLSLAKAFGASNDQAKLITEAAVELSAATGKSLQEATQQVSKTLGGFAGELGEVNPAIKALTKEQLQAGGAAKILIEQYGGTAAAALNTFSGAVAQTSNTFGDLQEELGFAITENEAIVASIQGLNSAFNVLIGFVKENREGIGDFIADAISSLIRFIPKFVKGLGLVVEGFFALKFVATDTTEGIIGFIKAILEIDIVSKTINFIKDAFLTLGKVALDVLSKLLGAFAKIPGVRGLIGGFLDDLSADFSDFSKSVGDGIGDDLVAGVRNTLGEIQGDLRESADRTLEDYDAVGGTIKKVVGVLNESANAFDANVKKAKELRDVVNDVPQAADKTFDFLDKRVEGLAKSLREAFSLDNIGKTLAGAVSEGEKAAKDLSATLLAALGDQIAPGVGQALLPFFRVLADQPPEEIKKQARIFAETLADSIPFIVEGLIVAVPEIVSTLIDSLITQGGIIRIADALVRVSPRIGVAIARGLAESIEPGFTAFNERFSAIGQRLYDDINRLGNNFAALFDIKIDQPVWITNIYDAIQKMPPWVTDLMEFLNRFKISLPGSGGGGGGGLISGTGTVLDQLQAGGVVPAGFPNDSYPAALSSGEIVVPAKSAGNLFAAIDKLGQGGGESGAMMALLAKIASLLEQGQTVSTSIEIDGNNLADAILQLDRQNARLTA